MPASEFRDWQRFFAIVPFSEDRTDIRFAKLSSLIANIEGKSLKEGQTVKTDEFLDDYFGDIEAARKHQREIAEAKSLEQQQADSNAFAERLRKLQAEAMKGK